MVSRAFLGRLAEPGRLPSAGRGCWGGASRVLGRIVGRGLRPLREASSSSSRARRSCCWWRRSSSSRTRGVRALSGTSGIVSRIPALYTTTEAAQLHHHDLLRSYVLLLKVHDSKGLGKTCCTGSSPVAPTSGDSDLSARKSCVSLFLSFGQFSGRASPAGRSA